MLVDLAWRPHLLDTAAVHDGDPVGHRKRLLLVVRDVDEGRSELRLDALQFELHLLAELDVERTERLVQEQRGRPIHERTCKRDALLLPAGELARVPALETFERYHSEHLVHALCMLAARHAFHLEPECDVVVDRHMRKKGVLLKDHVDRPPIRRDRRGVFSVEEDPTGIG